MDHGTLTDTNGRKVDFRNVILVMTTNAGAEQTSRASMGFQQQDHASDALGIIKKSFSPEFRNRLDAIVQFTALDFETVTHVVDKFIIELEAQLEERNVSIDIAEDARHWLAQHGYDPLMGARPMSRLIQEKMRRPLADQLLFGELEKGGHVMVKVENDDIILEYESENQAMSTVN
jgi:ATP-dependent Clp protease ATP-binding subunit ClpA